MMVKADLHIHSTYSDGFNSPREIIYYGYYYKGLKVISITDHDTFHGSMNALTFVKNSGYDILVVLGAEVRTDHGDVLIYCEKEIDFPKKLDQLVDYAHENNCLVVPAHPFDILRLGVGDSIYEYKWDAIEVWNASANKGANYRAIKAAKQLGLPALANSDAHVVNEIALAYTEIEMDELCFESFLKAIRRGLVKPIYGSMNFRLRARRIFLNVKRFLTK